MVCDHRVRGGFFFQVVGRLFQFGGQVSAVEPPTQRHASEATPFSHSGAVRRTVTRTSRTSSVRHSKHVRRTSRTSSVRHSKHVHCACTRVERKHRACIMTGRKGRGWVVVGT